MRENISKNADNCSLEMKERGMDTWTYRNQVYEYTKWEKMLLFESWS